MNVLSLFDGMSCGQIALNRLGISYDNYFASELDKYAIKVTQNNFPNTVQLGDVTKVNVRADGIYVGDDILTEEKISKVIPDLLIGGSPCQGFSFAGKQLNFEDPRSKLFFEYVRILNEIRKYNPSILFLLENVKMKKEYQDIISEHMGCEPIKINSALVSAQNRERLYWTNIPVNSMPEDKGILLKDVIEYGEVDRSKSLCIEANYHKGGNEEMYLNKSRRQIVYNVGRIIGRRLNSEGVREDYNKNISLTQCLEIRRDNNKSNCLTTVDKDNVLSFLPPGRYENIYNTTGGAIRGRYDGTDKIKQQLEIRKDGKSNALTTVSKDSLCVQIGKAVDINGHDILKRVYSTEGKSPTLNTMGRGNREPKIATDEKHYRKLTPIECERLQTVPDNYTACVSNSQRYKMLGNGWTVDVICHLLKNIDLIC